MIVQMYELAEAPSGRCQAIKHTKSHYGEYDATQCTGSATIVVRIISSYENGYTSIAYARACSWDHLSKRWRKLFPHLEPVIALGEFFIGDKPK